MCIGAPFEVAPDLDDAGLEQRRLDLEATLHELMVRTSQLVAAENPEC
jgi:hypothetical protein